MTVTYSAAVISTCGRYRYTLERALDTPGKNALFIMVNPSTADGMKDDATIRKLIGFSGKLGIGRFKVGNLFAYRATDIKELASMNASDATGPENDQWLRDMIRDADLIVCAWGPVSKLPKGFHRRRWQAVRAVILEYGKTPYSLGQPAKDGHPCHPLMLSYETPLTPWDGAYAASM